FLITSIGDRRPYALRTTCAHIGRKAIFRAAFYPDAAIPGIPNAITRHIGVHPEVVRVGGIQRLVGAKDELASGRGEVSFRSDRQYGVPTGQFLIEFE